MEKLLILDANALLHRCWHAIPLSFRTSKGVLVNAAFGFISVFLKALKDIRPNYIFVAFDSKGPTFRDKIYKEYKIQRPKKPSEFYNQFSIVKEFLKFLNIPVIEIKGVEADDIISSIVKKFKKEKNLKIIILTGDQDALQLVDKNVFVYTFKKGLSEKVVYSEKEVLDRFKIQPFLLADFKALKGDVSDNIPGVPGIGEKTAISLIKRFKNIENLYKILEKDSKEIKKILSDKIIDFLKKNKEKAFLSKKLVLPKADIKLEKTLEDSKLKKFDSKELEKFFRKYEFKSLFQKYLEVARIYFKESPKKKISKVLRITSEYLEKKTILKFLLWQNQYYFDINDKKVGVISSILEIKKILENEKIKKVSHNFKDIFHNLKSKNLNLKGEEMDLEIAYYLLSPGRRDYSLERLIFQEYGENISGYEKVIFLDDLYKKAIQEINNKDLKFIFYKIEMPLIRVLAEMEDFGIKVDLKYLSELNKEISNEILKKQDKIYSLAGCRFNLNSPKQLKDVLFKKLNISPKGIKKVKTGLSTAAGELEKLRKSHKIIDYIFKYRELFKLKSTYIDSLVSFIDSNSRIHTKFSQTITSTGRLSSFGPNLQNIPIRTELGKKIRKAFIAEEGYKLVSFDYSQIELRIAAHISQDKNMISAFNQGKDIHKETASKIFEIPFEKVSKDLRRKAKEANFGVLYGLGSFGLSQRMGITKKEAEQFIKRYFTLYPNLKKYISDTLKFVKENGFSKTIFGRRRYLPEIFSQIKVLKSQAERMAINFPIQGTAADIIKLAMNKIYYDILSKENETIRMLLQVHDELVFEIKEDKLNNFVNEIKCIMENIYKLKVPLKVDIHISDRWEK